MHSFVDIGRILLAKAGLLFRLVGTLGFGNLGGCMRCMRAALLTAIGAWAAAVLLLWVGPPIIPALAIAVASGATILWLAHIVAFAKRSADRRGFQAGRREFLAAFAHAFAWIGLATVFAAMPRPARASGECPTTHPYPCGADYCCDGPSYYYCEGYTGYTDPWRRLGTFCTSESSDEAVADLRSNCRILVRC